jgi:membrane-associated phospholipid phosphatase
VLGAGAIAALLYLEPQPTPRWSGGILFDDAARDAVRLRSPRARDAARTASDVSALSAIGVAVAIDSLVVPLARHSTEAASQLTLVDAEAFALSSLLATSASALIGRARPSYADCQRDPSFDPLCDQAPTRSFWSGHTAAAFTAAGLSCAHHEFVHVYGSPLADALGCAGMITLATTTGTLRVLGDRHYLTDVIAGALFGFGVGYAVPVLFHYTAANDSSKTASPVLAPASRTLGFQFAAPF